MGKTEGFLRFVGAFKDKEGYQGSGEGACGGNEVMIAFDISHVRMGNFATARVSIRNVRHKSPP